MEEEEEEIEDEGFLITKIQQCIAPLCNVQLQIGGAMQTHLVSAIILLLCQSASTTLHHIVLALTYTAAL